MPDNTNRPGSDLEAIARVLKELRAGNRARHEKVEEKGLPAELELLRTWQSRRLAQTYEDLLAKPRYAPACLFFLTDIYAAKDFSQRDHDMVRIYNLMARLLPERMIRLLKTAIMLNELTTALDEQLSQVLFEELGVAGDITPAQYSEAYRICDNYDVRVQQIELIREVGTGIHKLVKRRLTGVTLELARIPAHSAGWGELHDFLERGYRAFKTLPDVHFFLQKIEHREKTILDNLFHGVKEPFDL